MPGQSFLSRVRRKLPELHPAERRLGELVCDFPGELASYSASELAALAGVSNATVTRFVRRLGYNSYEDARRDARDEARSGSRLYLQTTGEEDRADPQSFLDFDIRNLRETFEDISRSDIDSLAEAIFGARRVWCVGYRASNALARYMQWQLLQAIEDTIVVPGGGQTMGEHVARITDRDVVVLFGLRRRIAGFDDLEDAIASTHPQIALITDEGMAVNQKVRWHFRCATRSSGPLFSHVAVMALIDLVTNRTIDIAAESGRQRLQRIEGYNDRLSEL